MRVARIAGVFYLLVSLTGGLALFMGGLSAALRLASLVVLKGAQSFRFFTDQLQEIAFLLVKWNAEAAQTSLVFFGFYCLLIGWLVVKSPIQS